MIKIDHDNSKELVSKHYQLIINKFEDKFTNFHLHFPGPPSQKQNEFLNAMKKLLKIIIIGEPKLLDRILKVLNRRFREGKDPMSEVERKEITDYLVSIYKDFSEIKPLEYAHSFEKEIDNVKAFVKSITLRRVKTQEGISGRANQILFIQQKIVSCLNQFTSNNDLDEFCKEKVSFLCSNIGVHNFLTLNALKNVVINLIDFVKEGLDHKRRDIPYDFNEGWGPYELVMNLGLNSCPYCNRQYINTFYSASGRTRAELDHFYPKMVYPFLSFSFFNLIPSCSVCNKLKGSKDTFKKPILHPYIEGFGDDYLFTLDIKKRREQGRTEEYDINFLFGNSKNFDIKFKHSYKANKEFIEKAKGTVDFFQLENLYPFHKDYVQELIKKLYIYNDSRIKGLLDQFKGTLFNNEEELLLLVLGNYTKKNELHKRPFSKLVRDISLELGIPTKSEYLTDFLDKQE